MPESISKITGHIEHYHWGKKGKSSLISRMIQNAADDKPYAELWFGTHPKGPSGMPDNKSDLRSHLKNRGAEILGGELSEQYQNELPFLFKVLSIEEPLSIQLHPDKVNAGELHKKDPKNYPDPNHKPEIAVALSEVQLVYGFRPSGELKKLLRKTPEYKRIIPERIYEEMLHALQINNPREFLRKLYLAVIKAEKQSYRKAAEEYLNRLKGYPKLKRYEELVLKVAAEYGPEDLAVFSLPLMNYCVLQPGQAIFTEPNKLHAYISGDLLECMANSDNVVRAGMTPKFQDLSALERLVEFTMQNFSPLNPRIERRVELEVHSYSTPCEEFRLDIIQGSSSADFPTEGPELWVCVEGSGKFTAGKQSINIVTGEGLLVPAETDMLQLESKKGRFARVSVPPEQEV